MTTWKFVMLAVLLLAAFPRVERWMRLRVWLAMMACSFAAYLWQNLWYYIALDLIAAAIIMMAPKTTWQRGIGLCYAAMVLMSIGHSIALLQVFSSVPPEPAMLKAGHDYMSWAALALMVLWGGDGMARTYIDGNGHLGGAPPAKLGRFR